MEVELGLKRPVSRPKRPSAACGLSPPSGRVRRVRVRKLQPRPLSPEQAAMTAARTLLHFHPRRPQRLHQAAATPRAAQVPSAPSGMSVDELIASAWKNRRADILARFGIYVTFDI